MAYRCIVISGPIASGSTTAAKLLSEKPNIPYKSAGDFFREYMLLHNIPLPQKEKIPDDVEKKVDDELTELAENSSIIIDGLYTGYFARKNPQVLRVLLTCDEEERIKRALLRTHTHKETAEDVKRRDAAHDAKFRKLYADENFLDPKFFDLVIDTTNTRPEEVSEKIIEEFQSGN